MPLNGTALRKQEIIVTFRMEYQHISSIETKNLSLVHCVCPENGLLATTNTFFMFQKICSLHDLALDLDSDH